MLKNLKFDKYITITTIIYLIFGFLMFFSASLGIMARDEEKFFNILQNQFTYGIVLGSMAFLFGILVPYNFLRKAIYPILVLAIVLCILVFVPGIGFYFNGSYRWIHIFGFSFQPSEILKYSAIISLSSFYYFFYNKIDDYRYRIFPLVFLCACVGLVIVEPDLGTSTICLAGIFGVFLSISAKVKDVLIAVAVAVIGLTAFYLYYPHASERIATFMNPEADLLGKSYQLNQGLISMGSGGFFGYGYAQSVQKYYHLPEPVGDSIFAIIGEELGFLGSLIIILTILFLCFRILYLGYLSNDVFAKGVLSGTATAILAQTFLNLGSISGAIPLTGVPLPLISHGSTSIIMILGMLGLCAQIGGKDIKYSV